MRANIWFASSWYQKLKESKSSHAVSFDDLFSKIGEMSTPLGVFLQGVWNWNGDKSHVLSLLFDINFDFKKVLLVLAESFLFVLNIAFRITGFILTIIY